MRILQLRFKNLNSLVGEWHIDFTDPAFRDAGIFAITGPTGAGKSTILDAICLALYGRTPRLGKISAGSNEILSRQQGECFAEVLFSSGNQQYRCHWSQRRARGQASGNLQQPRQELVEAATDKVLFSKITDVAQALEEITGMDFDRFTRSILLAQGGFDAFLKADADQRSPILEQLTGTDIYSQISIQVHQRRGEEAQRLEQLREQLAAMRIISGDELAELKQQHADCKTRCKELEQQREQIKMDLDWWQQEQQCEQEQQQFDQDALQLQHDQADFAPRQAQLHRARQALELSALAQTVAQQREHICQSESRRQTLEQQQSELAAQCDLAQRALDQAADHWQRAEQAWPEQQQVWREARRLDTEIKLHRKQLEQLEQRLQQNEHSQLQRQQGLESLRGEQQRLTAQLSELAQQRHQSAADARLVTEFGALEQRFQQLQERYQEHQGLRQQEQELRAQEQGGNNEQHQRSLEQAQHNQQAAEADWQQAHQNYQDIIRERSTGAWRQHLNALQTCLQLGKNLEQAYQRLQRYLQQQQSLQDKLSTLPQALQQLQERCQWLEEKRLLLVQQKELQQRITDLSQLRQQLEHGEACPLCGATEHPYAHELPELGDPAQDSVTASLDQEIAEAGQQLRQLEAQQIGWHKEHQLNLQQAQELQLEIRRTEDELKKHLPADTPFDRRMSLLPEQMLAELAQNLTSWQQQHNQATQQLESIEQAQAQLEQLGYIRDQANQQLNQAQSIYSEHQAQKQKLAIAITENIQRQQKLSDAIKKAGQALKHDLESYGIKELSAHSLEPVARQLAQRRDQWHQLEQRHQQAERDLEKTSPQLASAEAELAELHRLQQALNDEVDQARNHLNQLQQERSACLDATDVDLHEQQAIMQYRAYQQKHQEAQQQTESAKLQHARIQADLHQLNHDIQDTQTKLTEQQNDFHGALSHLGFANEEDYYQAVLTTAQRQALEEQEDKLQARSHHLAARHKQLQLRHQSLLSTPRPSVAADELRHTANEIDQEYSTQQQQLGRLQHQLDEQQQLGQEQAQRQAALEIQQVRYRRWEELHRLIGSSDGKRYRNFVQGLTFDRLISQANRELQRMSSRYLLSRAPDSSLELNVIDHFQAGEQRSAKNLSGGESFIISLALALGLSHMASHKARVDSLFLDEGFGTLDEDALELALDTLSSLQQEGKLIGLISHVPALKERIATQIQVRPIQGGRSRIQGPGCSAL